MDQYLVIKQLDCIVINTSTYTPYINGKVTFSEKSIVYLSEISYDSIDGQLYIDLILKEDPMDLFSYKTTITSPLEAYLIPFKGAAKALYGSKV